MKRSFHAPLLVTPAMPEVRFLASYSSPHTWDCWVGEVSRPQFIGIVRKLAPQDWRSIQFPHKKFTTRKKAGEFLR